MQLERLDAIIVIALILAAAYTLCHGALRGAITISFGQTTDLATSVVAPPAPAPIRLEGVCVQRHSTHVRCLLGASEGQHEGV